MDYYCGNLNLTLNTNSDINIFPITQGENNYGVPNLFCPFNITIPLTIILVSLNKIAIHDENFESLQNIGVVGIIKQNNESAIENGKKIDANIVTFI